MRCSRGYPCWTGPCRHARAWHPGFGPTGRPQTVNHWAARRPPMRWEALVAGLVVLVAFAGCADPPAAVAEVIAPAPAWPPLPEPVADPLTNGPLAWTTTEYDLGKTEVGGADAKH